MVDVRQFSEAAGALTDYYSAFYRGAEYCDERICLSVCIDVCVCLSVSDNIFGTTRPIFTNFLCMLAMALARSSSGGVKKVAHT